MERKLDKAGKIITYLEKAIKLRFYRFLPQHVLLIERNDRISNSTNKIFWDLLILEHSYKHRKAMFHVMIAIT